jgi:hypothetical protein
MYCQSGAGLSQANHLFISSPLTTPGTVIGLMRKRQDAQNMCVLGQTIY